MERITFKDKFDGFIEESISLASSPQTEAAYQQVKAFVNKEIGKTFALPVEAIVATKEYHDMREMGFTLEYDQKNNPNDKLARAAMCMISTTLPTDQRLDIEWPEDMDLTMGGYLMSNQKSRKKKLCIAVAFILAQLALDEAGKEGPNK